MSDVQYCPRAVMEGRGGPNSPFNPPFNGEMVWRTDHTCSWCGSLSGDALMARLEAGDVSLTPTDKNYKVYVNNAGGEAFTMSCPKFYFQHFTRDQQTRFIELYNAGKIKMGVPGHFYVTPYFCVIVRAPAPDDGA